MSFNLKREPVPGDTFWQGDSLPNYGQSIVRSIFGQPFLDALGQLPPDRWQGPIETRPGIHFVRITGQHSAALIAFDLVRGQVENDYLMELIQVAVRHHVDALEQGYVVEIER